MSDSQYSSPLAEWRQLVNGWGATVLYQIVYQFNMFEVTSNGIYSWSGQWWFIGKIQEQENWESVGAT